MSTRPAPRRVMSVSRPGWRSGSSLAHRATTSSAVADGPILAPTGLDSPDKNSRWAPPGRRVRSPTHTRWAEVSYQSPVSESRLVMASSKPRMRASWLVQKSTWCSALPPRLTPHARMNRKARSISPARAS